MGLVSQWYHCAVMLKEKKTCSWYMPIPPSIKYTRTRVIEGGVGVHVICLVCQGKQNWLWLTFYWHFSLVRDTDGCTPFMAAVRGRAYHAALTLFTTAQCLATNPSGQIDRNVVISMVCPSDSHPDASPLHVLCCNDTCSFTWTGTEHINQDIFECRTCGLTGSLCCCTECARVCHRGHDCK